MRLKTQLFRNNISPMLPMFTPAPIRSRTREIRNIYKQEVLAFLSLRPVHTVAMAGFIKDNGLESSLNRGKFYGYRNAEGTLEGVALIGHTTLVEARSEDALKALAYEARASEVPLHLIMSEGSGAENFWNYLHEGTKQPRLTCTEVLFEITFPMAVQKCDRDVRPARMSELDQVAEAQADISFMECGVDPMQKDRDGFLKRVSRRIEQGRVFVVFENGQLVFKADIISETENVIYLEGIYVAPSHRGQGVGSACLAKLSADLLNRVPHISLLSNVSFTDAHSAYLKAGFRKTGSCVTIFV